MTVLLTAIALAVPHHQDCQSLACVERVAARDCSQTRVLPCIKRAAIHWRVSEAMLKARAWCESRHRWWAHNPSGASGLFQFLPSTFASTPYARHWIFSAKYSSLAAAWMVRVGRGGEWVCA